MMASARFTSILGTRRNSSNLIAYAMFSLLASLLFIAPTFASDDDIHDRNQALKVFLTNSFKGYDWDNAHANNATEYWNMMQGSTHCCGVDQYGDWNSSRPAAWAAGEYPSSCCLQGSDDLRSGNIKAYRCKVEDVFKTGCIDRFNTDRLTMTKLKHVPPMADFAQDSIEARVSEATTKFGLDFMNNVPLEMNQNIVISPISLQSLFNMILLGARENTSSQHELVKALGYEERGLHSDRLVPHKAMRSVFQNIIAATHLSISPAATNDLDTLLNTNLAALNSSLDSAGSMEPIVANVSQILDAHLQTSLSDRDTPLSGQVNFTLANLLLTNRDMLMVKADYKRELETYYNVKIESFSKLEPSSAASNSTSGNLTMDQIGTSSEPLHIRVNNWVKNMTQGQIDSLVEEADLSADQLMMVLLNAAHFKGRWLHTFNPNANYDGKFYNHGSTKEVSEVKFMRQKAVFGYADFGTASLQVDALAGADQSPGLQIRASEDSETLLTEDFTGKKQGLEDASAPAIELSKEETRRLKLTAKLNCSVLMLPFSLNEGQELSMVILLPAKRDGIAELQASLDSAALNEIYKSLSEQHVQVELPKFSFDSSHDAKDVLMKLGIRQIFEDASDLDRMYDLIDKRSASKVDKVIHKAKISVDETGAEAAASSMASIVLRNFIRPPTPVFMADHPFLFIIRHNRSNMPLFMGRVSSL